MFIYLSPKGEEGDPRQTDVLHICVEVVQLFNQRISNPYLDDYTCPPFTVLQKFRYIDRSANRVCQQRMYLF